MVSVIILLLKSWYVEGFVDLDMCGEGESYWIRLRSVWWGWLFVGLVCGMSVFVLGWFGWVVGEVDMWMLCWFVLVLLLCFVGLVCFVVFGLVWVFLVDGVIGLVSVDYLVCGIECVVEDGV